MKKVTLINKLNSITHLSFIPGFRSQAKESCYACHKGASDSDSAWTKSDNF